MAYTQHRRGEEPKHFDYRDAAACSAECRGYICTGPEGHAGRHYADGISDCCASWDEGDE